MKLVKDFQNFQFVYYWHCQEKGKISPTFPTLVHASEWQERYKSTHYQGQERRSRKSAPLDFQRRESDRPVQINVDVAAAKVAKLRAALEQRAA